MTKEEASGRYEESGYEPFWPCKRRKILTSSASQMSTSQELTDGDSVERPPIFRDRKRGKNLKTKVIKEEVEDISPAVAPPVQAASPGGECHLSKSSRLFLDALEGDPVASEAFKKYISPANLLIMENKAKNMPTLDSIFEAATRTFLETFKCIAEMDKRMSYTSQSLALSRERELQLQAELKASKAKAAELEAKLVEYESTIRHLQRSLETVCSTQQAALAGVDRAVKAAKVNVEAVVAELAAKQSNSTTTHIMDVATERMREPVQNSIPEK